MSKIHKVAKMVICKAEVKRRQSCKKTGKATHWKGLPGVQEHCVEAFEDWSHSRPIKTADEAKID